MNMVSQARRMFEEKIARHRAHRDRLVSENAPRSQIEFVERCISDLERMIAVHGKTGGEQPAAQAGRAARTAGG
jgi:hypothetical protein